MTKKISFNRCDLRTMPSQLVSCFGQIGALWQQVVKLNLTAQLTAELDALNSARCHDICLSIADTDEFSTAIAVFKYDPETNIFQHQSSHPPIISFNDLTAVLDEYREERTDSKIGRIIANRKSSYVGDYYVYRHIFHDGSWYIGKGTGNRASDLKRRNRAYARKLEEFGEPLIDGLAFDLEEKIALELESDLIIAHRSIYDRCSGLNGTEGFESVSDLCDMPIATINAISRKGKILHDPKFDQLVNIFHRSSPEPGSMKMYYHQISAFDAARIVRCTVNEILHAERTPGYAINGFHVLCESDFQTQVSRR